MLFDLINPSDPYTLEADDFEIAAVAVCLLGAGKYPATALGNDAREDNNVPPFLFGGHDDWFNQRFGASFEATAERVLEGRADALARALESVKLSSNRRTSLNDIGGKAHEMASAVREQYLTPTPPKDE